MCISLDRYKSENYGDSTDDKLSFSGTARDRSAFASVGSAEATRSLHPSFNPSKHSEGKLLRKKKRRTLINPFDPAKMHTEVSAFQQRWMHIFPVNKKGEAFQVHHAATPEKRTVSFSDPDSASNTPPTPHTSMRKSSLKKSILSSAKGSDHLKTTPSNGVKSGGSSGVSSLKQSPVNSFSPGGSKFLKRLSKGSPSLSGSLSVQRQKPDKIGTQFSLSQPNTPECLRPQKDGWVDALNTENFASVRRTGMDWTSLVLPTHLPVTTDYFPAKAVLDREYLEYNTNLVVFGDDQLKGGSEEKRFVDVATIDCCHITLSLVVQATHVAL